MYFFAVTSLAHLLNAYGRGVFYYSAQILPQLLCWKFARVSLVVHMFHCPAVIFRVPILLSVVFHSQPFPTRIFIASCNKLTLEHDHVDIGKLWLVIRESLRCASCAPLAIPSLAHFFNDYGRGLFYYSGQILPQFPLLKVCTSKPRYAYVSLPGSDI